jgi:hypothetical protein
MGVSAEQDVLMVYQNGVTVTRRYSEFAYLWEVLLRRYPFRLFPSLPPKRIGREVTLMYSMKFTVLIQ